MFYKKIFILITCIFLIFTSWFYTQKGSKYFVFYGDALGYYIYLPAYFKYDQLLQVDELSKDTLRLGNIAHQISHFKIAYLNGENGYSVIQYTYMNAAFHAPLFLCLHVIDTLFNIDSTGFEGRYLLAIRITDWLYLFFGCFFIYKIFKDKVNNHYLILTYLIIGVLTTNIYWFAFAQNGMAHVVVFFLVSLLFYCTVQLFSKNDTPLNTTYLFWLIFSVITLFVIRPTDVLFALFVLLYNVTSYSDIKNRVMLLFNHWKIILLFTIPLLILLVSPQLIYWKCMTGHYVFNSYGEQGFNWLHPKLIRGLFGGTNGWLMYSPFMFVPVLFGIIKMNPQYRLSFWFLFIIYIYVIYAWWCFNYINGLGSRPMIHIYPLLWIVMIDAISKFKNKYIHYSVLFFSIVGMLINLQFSIKQYEGKLLSQQSSFAFNVSTFLKNNLSVNDLYTYDLNYVQDIHYQKIKTLQRISFDTLPNGYFINDDYAEYLPFSMNHSLDTTFKSHHRLMIEGTFMCMNDIYDIYGFSKIVLSVNRKGKEIIWRAVVINNKLGKSQQPSPNHLILNSNTHTWDKVQVFTQANEILPGDVLKVYVWNSGKQKLAIKNLTLSEVD